MVFGNTVISENWIESTGIKWNSSGNDLPGFTELGILDEIQMMMTESKSEPGAIQREESSSCQCTMTLIGENEETRKIVLRMLSELLSVLED